MSSGTEATDTNKENINGFQRLFFALCPDDDLLMQMAKLEDFGNMTEVGRCIPVDNLHITLVFLGQIDTLTRACIEQIAAEVGGDSFRLVLDRVGYWSRPQILWLAPSHVPSALTALFENMLAGLGKCRVTLDKRPYRPHITLARKVKNPPPRIKFEPLIWHVRQYSLMESLPSPDGRVNYQELACWKLG